MRSYWREKEHRGKMAFCVWLGLGGMIAFSTNLTYALEASDLLSFSLGPVSLRPQASMFTEYNDNIFYRESNAEGDLLIGITPGIRALFGEDMPEENHISASFGLEQDFYLKHSDLNATQYRFALDGFYGTERTKIYGTDRIELLSSTLGGFTTVTGLKIDRTIWLDIYRVEYRFGERTAGYVRSEHGFTDYERGVTLFDLRSLDGALGFEWFFSEDTKIFGEGYYGTVLVDSNTNTSDPPGTQYGGGFIGGRGKFTEKLSGILKAGYEIYQFDDIGVTAGGTGSGKSPVVEASLSYLLTERTTLMLDYGRQQRVSPEFSRSAYVADEITAGVSLRIGSADRLRVNVAGQTGFYSYDPSPFFAKRTDTIWGVSTGISWSFQTWFAMRLDYNYSRLHSDLATITEYDQNRVRLSLTIGY